METDGKVFQRASLHSTREVTKVSVLGINADCTLSGPAFTFESYLLNDYCHCTALYTLQQTEKTNSLEYFCRTKYENTSVVSCACCSFYRAEVCTSSSKCIVSADTEYLQSDTSLCSDMQLKNQSYTCQLTRHSHT